jgi:ribulose-phosphate 3-epimerase
MATICPSVTPINAHEYREQMEKVTPFAKRIHLDFMDGELAPTESPGLEHAWWPDGVKADLHLMYQQPGKFLPTILKLKPSLVIVHAEADGDFLDFAGELHRHGIRAGVALLPDTPVAVIEPSLKVIDHVLIFSGDLGHFGGKADLSLMGKASEIKALKPNIEVGWDGGVNAQNAKLLAANGIDVLNVGGFIQKAENPEHAYAKLKQIV